MSTENEYEKPAAGGADMVRVLDAEKAAEKRISEATAMAQDLLRDATRKEREIAARTERRIQKLHAQVQADIARAKAGLQDENRAIRKTADAEQDGQVHDTVARLARLLLGLDER